MRKVIMGAVLLGALTLAGQASARTVELNVWGASAQFNMWNEVASTFLQGAPYNCANVTKLVNSPLGITIGSGNATQTANCSDGNIYVIRYSSKSSYDGILALQGQAKSEDITNPSQNTNFCDPATYPAAGTNNYAYRVMYSNLTGAKACLRVDLAASDVQAASFTQTSPLRSFAGYPNGIPVSASWNVYNPMVVPFGFFAHTDVTVSKCSGGLSDGQQCASSADCAGGSCGAATQLDDISRMQAIMIFSRQAVYWTDFGQGYASAAPTVGGAITACYREAGSGTHSTMDYAVMKSNGAVVSQSLPTGTGGDTSIVFNDGTGAMMTCINGTAGAIGYADADQALSMAPLWAAQGKTGTPHLRQFVCSEIPGCGAQQKVDP